MFSLEGARRLTLSSASFVIVALAVWCAAQTSRVAGAVQGTVVDQTGSAVAGVTVKLRNQGTNQTRTLSTNPEGSFRAGELPVGRYELRVESPGFSPYVNNAIVISIGRVAQLTVRLAPARVQQQITVSEQPPQIDATQTTEATSIDHERIEESPVVSRNYLDFVLLAPQLTQSNIQGATGGKSALADSGFTFAGLRSRSNSLYIDGVENNDEYSGSARTELSPETVQEFQVVNNGLSAESGGGASGPINVITKSGVNTLHGDAFVFVQNGAFNAREPLTNETEAPDLNRFRAGLSAGGPIVQGRTFYYFAGEQEGAHGDDSSLISPSVASAINGVLGSGAFPRIATRTINPELFRTSRAETEVSGRLDHHIADKHSLLLKYALTNNREVGDAFNTGGLVDPSGRGSSFIEDQGVTGSLTSVLSNNILNSVRFQLSTRRAVLRTADQTGPEISIAGLVDFGRPYDGNDRRRENHYELSDVASTAKGRHLFSFGGDLDWIRERVSAYDGFGAVYVFPTLDAFLSGQPDQYRQAFGNPPTNFATPKYSGFIQDHWTVTNRFTIDAGIRYDFEHLPAQFREDTNDFAPRIGLAYSPSSNWAVRAGYGIFFDRYLLAAVSRALEKNGTLVVIRSDNYILIGAGSLVSQVNPDAQLPAMSGCKILKAGRFFVAVAGIFSQGGPGGFNAYAMLQEVAQHEKTAVATADRFDTVAKRPYEKLLLRFYKKNPKVFEKVCNNQACMQLLVADYNGGNPMYAVRLFRVVLKHDVPTVEIDPNHDCPGTCPLPTSNMVIGDDIASKPFAASPVFWAEHSPASFIEGLIQIEARAHPTEVGGPVSILALDKNGAHWVPGYQGVCPDLK